MAKIAKTADRTKGYGHHQEHGLPEVRQAHPVVKRVKDREKDIQRAACTSHARSASFTRSCRTPTVDGCCQGRRFNAAASLAWSRR